MLGVTFGSKHSYNDWGIWLEDTHINPPLPKRYIVDVPARNGLLDLTPELTPTIRFENRTLTFNFRVKAGDWSTLVSKIYGDIHGQTLDVVSDLDPNWHWHGCVTVDDFSSDERTGKLVITVDADPFKLSNTENSYTVNGNGTITCVVDRMEISPAFEIEAPTTVIYGDSSYALESTATTEKTLSGDIVSFVNGTANPAVDLTADIDAVQDLHGYDHPWVGGAGKNKLEVTGTSTTIQGITFNVNQDGTITISGTFQTQVNFVINATCYLKAGDYIFNGIPSAPSLTTFQMYITVNGNKYASVSGTQFTVDTDGEYPVYVSIYGAVSGTLTFKPMIRLASETDATFEPYSNICPISGWDEVNVNVAGKNRLAKASDTELHGITATVADDGTITLNGTTTTVSFIRGVVALDDITAQYSFSAFNPTVIRSSVEFSLREANGNLAGGWNSLNSENKTYVFTPDTGKIPTKWQLQISNGKTFNNYVVKPMLVKGSTPATTYEPYNGQTYAINLNGTRYGGTLDVTTGVLTIDKTEVDLGTLNWVANGTCANTFNGTSLNPDANVPSVGTNWICSQYKAYDSSTVGTVDAGIAISTNKFTVYVRDIRYSDPATFKTAMSGVQLVYELATPQTVQLTPTQVTTLLGQNNIWADSGEVEVTYLAQDFAGKTFYIPDLELTEGSHELTIQGTGTTKVTYTNGRL